MGRLSHPPSVDPLPLGSPCAAPSSQSTLGQERAAHHTPAPTLDAASPATIALCLGGSPHDSEGVVSSLPGATAQFEHHSARAPAQPAHDPPATPLLPCLSSASRCDLSRCRPCHRYHHALDDRRWRSPKLQDSGNL